MAFVFSAFNFRPEILWNIFHASEAAFSECYVTFNITLTGYQLRIGKAYAPFLICLYLLFLYFGDSIVLTMPYIVQIDVEREGPPSDIL